VFIFLEKGLDARRFWRDDRQGVLLSPAEEFDGVLHGDAKRERWRRGGGRTSAWIQHTRVTDEDAFHISRSK
jgi:hypothetical protein